MTIEHENTPPDCSICNKISRHLTFVETWLCPTCLKFLRALKSDNSEFVKAFCKKFDISFKEKTPPSITPGVYICYECKKVNHGTPVYQTNSKHDYEIHIQKHPQGTALCYPNKADLERHSWEPQGKEWET